MHLLQNLYYLIVISAVTIVFEISYHLVAKPLLYLRGYKRDDIYRIKNAVYGKVCVRASWPVLKVKMKGRKNVPKGQPCVFVYNHRSNVDIFFASMVPRSNLMVFVRSWPFRLRLFGWSMQRANYINSETTAHDELVRKGLDLVDRKVSFVVFPEGHRSRDGKLRRFYSGAFYLSIHTGIPIVPVVMTGIEKFFSTKFPFINTANVEIELLEPVYPQDFTEGQPWLRMRKHVEGIYRKHLGEEL